MRTLVRTKHHLLEGLIMASQRSRGRVPSVRTGVIALLLTASANADRITEFQYDGFRVTDVQVRSSSGEKLSRTVTEYDKLGREILVRRVVGFPQDQALNDTTDEITIHRYDMAGNLVETVRKGPPSNTDLTRYQLGDDHTTYAYDAVGRQTKVAGSLERETLYTYDRIGRIVRQTILLDRTTGATCSSVHVGCAVTETYIDPQYLMTKVTDPEGHYRETFKNSRGSPTREISYSSGGVALLSQRRWYYDVLGRQTRVALLANAAAAQAYVPDPAIDQITDFVYDAGGRVIEQRTYNMNLGTPRTTVFQYDGYGRLTRVTDPGGNYTETVYNSLGLVWVRGVNDGLGTRDSLFTYDAIGRVASTTAVGDTGTSNDDLVTQYEYDALDRQISVTDPQGQQTTYLHDALGRQIHLTEDAGNMQRHTDSGYDRLGQLISLTAYDDDAAMPERIQITEYVHNPVISGSLQHHKTQVVYPDRTGITLWYDEGGRLIERRSTVDGYDYGIPIYFTYDRRGLLLQRNAGSGLHDDYAYDGLGRMTVATAYQGIEIARTTFVYNDLSQAVEETQRLFEEPESVARVLAYTYDQAGNRRTLGFNNALGYGYEWINLAYDYDAMSQNTKVRAKFWADNFRPLTTLTDMISYEYAGRHLTKRSVKTLYSHETPYAPRPPDLFLDHVVEYDAHGRVAAITNKTVYDGADLDEIAKFTYAFSNAGNRLASVGNRGAGYSAAGYGNAAEPSSVIPHVQAYGYDSLYRLTSAVYNPGGPTEEFVYDQLGNRVSYTDHRTTTTITYLNGVANAYSLIDPPGRAPVYEPRGSLFRDEFGYLYTYDAYNRLTSVDVDYFLPDPNPDPPDEPIHVQVTVASFAYDALGRMIRSRTQFDQDENAEIEDLKFYYDGPNVIAEYDKNTNALVRRYIHGTNRIDERAILIEGSTSPSNPGPCDLFYYALRELDTVTALVAKNGALVEAYSYDAYGEVTMWGYHQGDFDRNGLLLTTDSDEYGFAFPSDPATDPQADADTDGDVDFPDDQASLFPPGPTLVRLYTSSVGNPYFFTGRRLHFLEMHPDATQAVTENRQLQYNRARHYDPRHGRWLQRDPAEYEDGMNLYLYGSNNPTTIFDPIGLYGRDVHERMTSVWAMAMGMSPLAARLVGKEDNDTDADPTGGNGVGWHPILGDQSRHFDRSSSGLGANDTRLLWARREMEDAKWVCRKEEDAPRRSARHLGRALHSVQDWWAHGSYSRGPRNIGYDERHGGPGDGVYYDEWNYDAETNSGRAPQVFDPVTKREIRYTKWVVGGKRNAGTRHDTVENLDDFLDFIRSGKAGCKCKAFFLRCESLHCR